MLPDGLDEGLGDGLIGVGTTMLISETLNILNAIPPPQVVEALPAQVAVQPELVPSAIARA